ncbi:MAG: hypothetical protein IPO66_18135 [Rhodanobacteraceae bacterium]|nr:hypothetical protein [Rhodanobacteraceae bacterium]
MSRAGACRWRSRATPVSHVVHLGPDGRPTWYVGGVLALQADGSYWHGPAYRTTGRRFDQIAGDVSATATEVGSFSVRPQAMVASRFTTIIGTVEQIRRIERTLRAPTACPFKGSRNDVLPIAAISGGTRNSSAGVSI